jgi:hypothetical protein
MLAVCFVLTVTVYNCAAVYVTKYLSAIWHAILDNFRPITIWGLDLAIFYVLLPGSGKQPRTLSLHAAPAAPVLVCSLCTTISNTWVSVCLF